MQPTGELVIEGSVIYSALLGITGGHVIVMDGANLNFTVRQNIPMVINSPCSIGAANVIFDTGVVNFLQKVFMQAGASANFMNTMACDRTTIFAPNTSLSVLPAFCQCHQCYLPVCFGKVSSDPTVCSGNGQCNTLNNCVCKLGYNDPTGRCCVDNGKCACKDGYIGSQCEIVICGGIWSNDPTVCSSRGVCNRPNQCDCPPGFIGSFCQFPVCYGLSLESGSKPCSGRGQCNSSDNCICDAGYVGSRCEDIQCFGKSSSDSGVCNGRVGNCTAPNTCVCDAKKWSGAACDLAICSTNQTKMCSGTGTCTKPSICECDYMYSGKNCECWGTFFGSECKSGHYFPFILFWILIPLYFLGTLVVQWNDARLVRQKYRIIRKFLPSQSQPHSESSNWELQKPLLQQFKGETSDE
jgi:hypothetical protein